MTDVRKSFFSTVPTDPSIDVDFTVPRETAAAVNKRLKEYLPELCRPLGQADHTVIAGKVVAISAGYHFTEQQTTLAKRKARLARMLKLFEQANGVLEIAQMSRGDDPDFFHSPLMMLVVEATGTVLEAQSALGKEIIRLGGPSKADNRKVANPTRWFLLAAKVLWMEETSARPRNSDDEYRHWLALLFQTITGEADRSFDKALRNLPRQHLQDAM